MKSSFDFINLHAMKAYEGVEVQLRTFLTWVPVGGQSPAARSELFTPFVRGQGGPLLPSEKDENVTHLHVILASYCWCCYS